MATGTTLDFESTQNYSARVEVCDTGRPVLCSYATMDLQVKDVNDPPVLSGSSVCVVENSPAGSPVGSPLQGYDEDIIGKTFGGWYNLTYSIEAGDSRKVFRIAPLTGQIEVARGTRGLLNYESNDANRFELVVRVSDQGGQGEPKLHAEARVVVDVTNINEPPIASPQTLQIAENAPRSPRQSDE